MVLRRGLGLAAAGAAPGVAGALIVSHLMAGLLYGVSPTDLPTFAGATVVLTTVAFAASCIPAPRAMRLDPITPFTPNDFLALLEICRRKSWPSNDLVRDADEFTPHRVPEDVSPKRACVH
jgi:hypothetical protein